MLNLFAFRATDPKVMKAALDPVDRTMTTGSGIMWGALI